jgi:uncharacterized protein
MHFCPLNSGVRPMKQPVGSRSRRLRKKLRVGEFRQLGFEVEFAFRQKLDRDQDDQFWDAFIIDAIESNNLTFGGGTQGFIVPEKRATATEAHRQIVHAWLLAQPEVASVVVGPLVDAWRSG